MMTKTQLLHLLEGMFLAAYSNGDEPQALALDVAIEVIGQDLTDVTDFDVEHAYRNVIEQHTQ